MLKNMSLGSKIIGGYVIIAVMIAGLIGFNWMKIESLREMQDAGAARAVDSVRAQEGAGMAAELYQIVADAIINRDMKSAREDWAEKSKETDEDITAIAKSVDTAEELEWAAKAEAAYAELKRIVEKELFPLLDATKDVNEAIRTMDGEIDKPISAIEENLTAICRSLGEESKKADAEFDSVSGSVVTISIVTGVVIVVIAILLGILLTRAITKPLNRIIAGLISGSEQVTSASGQVSGASQQLAQGASEQASSLEETSSSLEEMASMTRQNADNANQANGTAQQASSLAETGVESMKKMQDAIDRIKTSAAETAKIIKTIDEIAFQTNLLALNAAVEAARAGEAGKGFAVVAEEVRNLARRSAEAAKNTADLIEGAQKNAEAGVQVTAEVAKNLGAIKDNTGKVATLIAEIAAASKEQSQGIDQVNTAVSEMDKVVQQNAANAEESASASEELSSQAEELNSMVVQLTAIVTGNSSTVATEGSSAPNRPSASGRKDLHLKGQGQKMLGSGKKTAQTKAASRAVKAEEVIPLDETELKGF